MNKKEETTEIILDSLWEDLQSGLIYQIEPGLTSQKNTNDNKKEKN